MAIDPPVKTKVTVDPDTGARVFNQSWSSEIKKKQPIQRKPVSRETFVTEPKKPVSKPVVKQVAKETTEKTSGKRKFNEVIVPSPAKAVGMEPKAGVDIKKKAPADPRYVNKLKLEAKADIQIKRRDEYLAKEYPNLSREKAIEKYYRIKNRQEKKGEREAERDWQSRVGGSNSKNKSAACTSC